LSLASCSTTWARVTPPVRAATCVFSSAVSALVTMRPWLTSSWLTVRLPVKLKPRSKFAAFKKTELRLGFFMPERFALLEALTFIIGRHRCAFLRWRHAADTLLLKTTHTWRSSYDRQAKI